MWQETANTLGISKDYEGTWEEEFFVPLIKTIDDMLKDSRLFDLTEEILIRKMAVKIGLHPKKWASLWGAIH